VPHAASNASIAGADLVIVVVAIIAAITPQARPARCYAAVIVALARSRHTPPPGPPAAIGHHRANPRRAADPPVTALLSRTVLNERLITER
jgi:hypothetical protein